MKRNKQEYKENMACEICYVKFNFLKRKKECIECHGECCSSCVVREHGKSTCKRCRVLMAVPPDRSALMRLKAKDLKQFLGRKCISHQGCTQKDELVELILQMTGYVNRPRPAPPPQASYLSENRPGVERVASSSHTATTPQSTWDQRSSTSRFFDQQPLFHSSPTTNSSSSVFNAWQSRFSDHPENNSTKAACSSPPSGKSEEPLASLENLSSEDEIDALSVRQLKLLLLRHFVDYKGCCEKSELQERVRRLWKQHKETEDIDPDTISNEQMCKICWEVPINCVLLECGHMATCTECGKRMHECPICRQYVIRVVHTFKA